MDIFEFGMQMERDGEQFYREIAAKSADKGMQAILNLLADSEVKHFNVLKRMREQVGGGLEAATLMPEVKNVFERMKEEGGNLDPDVSQKEMYGRAREIELKSETFYREQAAAAEAAESRKIFGRLADEEKEHARILDNLLELLGRPETWLENAEWRHADEY